MPQCYQSVVIDASIDAVWETIRDFHDMSWGQSVITSCVALGELSGTEAGAKRVLNEVFYETLLECNPQHHRIRYSIDQGPSPLSSTEVSHYIGELTLLPVTLSNTTFAQWSSSWQSESGAAVDFCHQIYVALLKELARKLSRPGFI